MKFNCFNVRAYSACMTFSNQRRLCLTCIRLTINLIDNDFSILYKELMCLNGSVNGFLTKQKIF